MVPLVGITFTHIQKVLNMIELTVGLKFDWEHIVNLSREEKPGCSYVVQWKGIMKLPLMENILGVTKQDFMVFF